MVEFFVGDTLDSTAVFEKIKERRGKGKRQILIVPTALCSITKKR